MFYDQDRVPRNTTDFSLTQMFSYFGYDRYFYASFYLTAGMSAANVFLHWLSRDNFADFFDQTKECVNWYRKTYKEAASRY